MGAGGERENIGKMAEKISEDIFSFFRWEKVEGVNLNFECCNKKDHFGDDENKHGHPVDVVFHYYDPYLKKRIYLNTDLKSYKSTSIGQPMIRNALSSLAKTIDCARHSEEWIDRYVSHDDRFEVRGFLFVYNHDGLYDKDFYAVFDGSKVIGGQPGRKRAIDISKLPIKKGQQLHVADPNSINYLKTVCKDIEHLSYKKKVPNDGYEFYYPDKTRVKAESDTDLNAATIETLFSPYMILRHPVMDCDRIGAGGEEYTDAYIVYYNRSGKNYLEFIYLLDMLSNYQVLKPHHKIRIRLASNERFGDCKNNFNKAVNACAKSWGFSEERRRQLNSIEFEVLQISKEVFDERPVGWGVQ